MLKTVIIVFVATFLCAVTESAFINYPNTNSQIQQPFSTPNSNRPYGIESNKNDYQSYNENNQWYNRFKFGRFDQSPMVKHHKLQSYDSPQLIRPILPSNMIDKSPDGIRNTNYDQSLTQYGRLQNNLKWDGANQQPMYSQYIRNQLPFYSSNLSKQQWISAISNRKCGREEINRYCQLVNFYTQHFHEFRSLQVNSKPKVTIPPSRYDQISISGLNCVANLGENNRTLQLPRKNDHRDCTTQRMVQQYNHNIAPNKQIQTFMNSTTECNGTFQFSRANANSVSTIQFISFCIFIYFI
ncbi:unnamed protein product [Rotaria socialis]|uniref:Uncharacterized protein n=1 Tax=Rotaria socialis TaxID=392032 RepID=A0A820C5U1_9BILA|nr:unnamed protein product [Rotaria socialis]CAF4217140.1 unnamed protein product [Rotaria socialis]CAF4485204.1 unnamed protein product [Rotaria socialis]